MSRRVRLVGGMILAGGTLFVLGVLGWLQAARADGELSQHGFALGLLLCLALVLPVMAGGIWLLVEGRLDLETYRLSAQTRRLRALLRGGEPLRLGDVLASLETDRQGLRDVAALAAREGLVGGHIDWRNGRLHKGELGPGVQRCPACGGTVDVGGRGTFTCPYCESLLIVASGSEAPSQIRGIAPPG